MAGIRTLEDLRERCRIDEETGCWHLPGLKDRSATGACFWAPALQRRVSVGVLTCLLRRGRAPKAGEVWHSTCGDSMCCNPDHRRCGNRSTQMLAHDQRRSHTQAAAIRSAKRRAGKLTPEAAAAIRASDEPLRVVAARHGVCVSTASKVRRGELWRPDAARGSSVFNLA